VLSILTCSCKEKSPEQLFIEEQHDEIMVIHDEVMPKMSKIHQLRKALKKSDMQNAALLVKSLDEADDMMMEWMYAYDKPSSTDDNYEGYLAEQKIEIIKVREAMLEAITQSSKALEQ